MFCESTSEWKAIGVQLLERDISTSYQTNTGRKNTLRHKEIDAENCCGSTTKGSD